MDRNIGIYIHIPFCASRCAYCDFCTVSGQDNLMPKYQSALIRNIREYAPQMESNLVDTVYFGGGTPSYFGSKRLVKIFNTLKRRCNVLLSAEVTVEMNPGDWSYRDFLRLKREGFNRLSIGVQSAKDDILKILGRRHSFRQVEDTVSKARRAGFENISLDLIYGLPYQTKEDWAETLTRAAALKPEHFSCYGLKIEEGTPLYEQKDSPFIPDDDAQADMYLYTVEFMERFGYRQYEISNFAQKGFESRHNMKYWRLDPYVGFGASAHSYVENLRYSYMDHVEAYISGVLSHRELISQKEEISKFGRASEYLMLGMRTVRGVSEQEYWSIYQSSFDPIAELLKSYEQKGWAKQIGSRWSFTSSGFLLSNRLIGEILDAQAQQKLTVGTPWKRTEVGEGQMTISDDSFG